MELSLVDPRLITGKEPVFDNLSLSSVPAGSSFSSAEDQSGLGFSQAVLWIQIKILNIDSHPSEKNMLVSPIFMILNGVSDPKRLFPDPALNEIMDLILDRGQNRNFLQS